MKIMKIFYFAYGSNMDIEQIKKRCPGHKLIGKAFLEGYKLKFDRFSSEWQGGVADIVKEIESVVWGLLFEITAKDLKNLDNKEGHPNTYKRFETIVIDKDGKEREVYTYEVVKKGSFTPPSRKYLNIIKTASRKYCFPEEYQNFINSIATS